MGNCPSQNLPATRRLFRTMSAFNEERVLSVHHWTDKQFSFTLTRDPAFRFSNGHFTMIGLRVNGKPLLRAYSIVSANYEEHLEFLRNTSLYSTFGDYVFVHAGVRPGVPLARQNGNDLTAIREPFLAAADPAPGRVVVFGHTPFREPLVQPRKIGLDTGACVTGRLTALALQDGERRFLQTGNPDQIWALPDWGAEPDEPPARL